MAIYQRGIMFSPVLHLIVSTLLGGAFFAAGMFLFLGPIGLLMDLIDPATDFKGVYFMSGLAGFAGIAFGLGLACYQHYLDKQLVMPGLNPDEKIRFRQYGYIITDKKYDPGRIVITNQRVFLLPTYFNAGPRIPDFVAPLSDVHIMKDYSFGNELADNKVQVLKDHSFGENLAGRFFLLKIKKKLVFNRQGKKIAYMSNLGYPLPPMTLFPR